MARATVRKAFGHSAAPQVDTLAAQPPAMWGGTEDVGGQPEDAGEDRQCGEQGPRPRGRRGRCGGAPGPLEDQGFSASALPTRGQWLLLVDAVLCHCVTV